jgi:SAM-dependent methyltransferase
MSTRDPSSSGPRAGAAADGLPARQAGGPVCALCHQALRPYAVIPAHYLDEVFYTVELQNRVPDLHYGRCCRCGAIWATDERRSDGLLASIYAELPTTYWTNLSGHPPSFEHWDGLLQRFARGRALCDVGCGDGKFLEGISKRWEKHGLELGREAVALCRGRGLDVRLGSPLTADPTRVYDVVTCIDTIEHVLDPRAELAAMARMLRAGGLLFVLTGDASVWTARLPGPWWEYLHCVGHVSVLSRRALLTSLRQLGLHVLYQQTVDHHAGVALRTWLRELARNYWRRLRGYRRYRRMHYHCDHQLVIARKPSVGDNASRRLE